MKVTLKQLRAFVAVAESGSFVEACDVVHLSQPALSSTIRNLEESVGGTLLARTTRALALTPEGEMFLHSTKQILDDYDGALEDLHNLFSKQRGKLNIAAMPSFAANRFPYVLVKFRSLYPNINIAIQDVIAEVVVEMVRTERVEFGVSFDPEERGELSFTSLFNDKFVAVLPQYHRLAEEKKIRWESLQTESLVLIQHPSGIRKQIDQVLDSERLNPSIEMEAHQLATIGRMVAEGLGVSIIPSLCIEQMEEIGAVCRPLVDPEISRDVGIITRSRQPLSVAAQEMISTLKAHFYELETAP